MQDRDEARRIRDFITDWLGWECTSRWIDEEVVEEVVVTLEDKKAWAIKAVEDVERCEAIILYNPRSVHGSGSGGRHVEFGYAAALGRKLILIGWPENIFHWLPIVKRFGSATDLVEEFKK